MYRGARKARFPLKPLYRTDRNRDTHIALCRLLSQKKQNLPGTQDQKELQRCELAATLCMCIWGANTGQRDELRHDADHSNIMCTDKQSETLVQKETSARYGAMPAQ